MRAKAARLHARTFSIAGKYTEWLVLGSAAVHYEGKLLYDARKGLVTEQ